MIVDLRKDFWVLFMIDLKIDHFLKCYLKCLNQDLLIEYCFKSTI